MTKNLDNPLTKHEGRELPAPLLEVEKGDLLLRYQQRALGEVSRSVLLVVEKGRRIGLTWAVAADAVTMAAASARAGGSNVFYVSYTIDITREFIDTCAMWARAFMNIDAQVGEFMFDDEDPDAPGETKHIKGFRIEFASGFVIQALSSRPRSIRGRQGLVIIDEAAFCDKLEELLKSALALIIWGARIVVISTHDGVDNSFNQLIDDVKSGKRKGSHIKITFDDAIADGLYERVRLCGKHNGMEKQEWIDSVYSFYGENGDEELRCIPKSGAGCFIPPELVIAAQHQDAGKPELYEHGPCVAGRDIAAGRDGDVASLVVCEFVGSILWTRECRGGRDLGILEQDEIFNGQFERYSIMQYGIDQTGMGEGEVARAKVRYAGRIAGLIFTPQVRLMLAMAVKRRLENGTARLPNTPEVRADFRGVKKSKGTGDAVRIITVKSGTTAADGAVHPDMFWSFALACWLADTDQPTCHGFRQVEKAAGRFDERPGDDGRTFRMRVDEPVSHRAGFGKGTW